MQPMRPLRPFSSSNPSIFTLPPALRLTLLRSAAFSKPFSTTRTKSQTKALTTEQPTFIPAPHEGDGPLLERMPNRALPSLKPDHSLWLRTLPIFIFLITISSLGIFNYQKSSSSTVSSILYSLRTSPRARELLGDEIYFASKIPWISGELNQLHGVIDISFWVKGTKGVGKTKFVSVRKRRDGFFETLEWSLAMEGGEEVQLLDAGEKDPMAKQRRQ